MRGTKKSSKFKVCPSCKQKHTGFTDKCADCLNALPEGALVIADETVTEFLTGQPNNVTPVTKRGRPRKYESNAARQKAWREGKNG